MIGGMLVPWLGKQGPSCLGPGPGAGDPGHCFSQGGDLGDSAGQAGPEEPEDSGAGGLCTLGWGCVVGLQPRCPSPGSAAPKPRARSQLGHAAWHLAHACAVWGRVGL